MWNKVAFSIMYMGTERNSGGLPARARWRSIAGSGAGLRPRIGARGSAFIFMGSWWENDVIPGVYMRVRAIRAEGEGWTTCRHSGRHSRPPDRSDYGSECRGHRRTWVAAIPRLIDQLSGNSCWPRPRNEWLSSELPPDTDASVYSHLITRITMKTAKTSNWKCSGNFQLYLKCTTGAILPEETNEIEHKRALLWSLFRLGVCGIF